MDTPICITNWETNGQKWVSVCYEWQQLHEVKVRRVQPTKTTILLSCLYLRKSSFTIRCQIHSGGTCTCDNDFLLKFRFSKKATKTLQNLPAEFHLLNIKSNGRFCQTFVAFIENLNFTNVLMLHEIANIWK